MLHTSSSFGAMGKRFWICCTNIHLHRVESRNIFHLWTYIRSMFHITRIIRFLGFECSLSLKIQSRVRVCETVFLFLIFNYNTLQQAARCARMHILWPHVRDLLKYFESHTSSNSYIQVQILTWFTFFLLVSLEWSLSGTFSYNLQIFSSWTRISSNAMRHYLWLGIFERVR